MMKQKVMSISKYFLKVKSICAKNFELDPNETISDAILRTFLIISLQKEYTPYVTPVQRWEKQPLVEELESLLSNQESLARPKKFGRNSSFLKRKVK